MEAQRWVKEMGSLNIKQPDDFDILIIGSAKDSKWIEEDLGGHIEDGSIQYIDRDTDRGMLEQILGDRADDIAEGPVVVVGASGEEAGMTCALSAVGDSLIVHCEDKIIPLEKRPSEKAEMGGPDGPPEIPLKAAPSLQEYPLPS